MQPADAPPSHHEITDCLVTAREFSNWMTTQKTSDAKDALSYELTVLHELMKALRTRRRLNHEQIVRGSTLKDVLGYAVGLNEKLSQWCTTQATVVEVKAAQGEFWLSFRFNEAIKPVRHRFEWFLGATRSGADVAIENLQVITGHKSRFGKLDVCLTPSHPWEPMLDPPDRPTSVGDYKTRKGRHWEDFVRGRAKTDPNRPDLPVRPAPIKSYLWHVERCYPYSTNYITGRTQVILLLRGCGFDDHVATTKQLDKPVWHGAPKLREWLNEAPIPGFVPHFPLGSANPLSVDIAVVTKDGKVIVRQQERDGPFESAIYGYVDALSDVHRLDPHLPSPKETVFQWGCRLLNIQVPMAGIQWLGVSLDSSDGTVSLLGEVSIELTYAEVEKHLKQAVEYKHRTQKIDKVGHGSQEIKNWIVAQQSAPEGSRPRSHVFAGMILTGYNTNKKSTFRTKSEAV